MDQKIERSENQTAIPNKDFDSDVEYALKLNRWILKPFGIWPLNSRLTQADKLVSVIVPSVSFFLLFFVIISSSIEMFTNEKDLKGRLEILGPANLCSMVAIKYFIFVIRGEKLKACIDTIVNDWRNVRAKQEREIMIRNAKIARLFTICCVSFMYGSSIFNVFFLPLITAKSLTSKNNLTIRILPYRCNLLYVNPYERPIFDILYTMHTACGFVMCSITTGTCSLAAKFVTHACGQCQIIVSLLENLIDEEKDCSNIADQKLAIIVLQHLHMMRFVMRVEDLLNEICLVEFLGSTMNMCLVGYYIITGFETADTLKFVTFALLFLSFAFNVFIFCYIGQILTNHCHQIGEASYMIDWYRFPGSQARFLVLLIGVANRPIILTAGKMVQLSFPSFGNVMKAAMAYLNILRTVTG